MQVSNSSFGSARFGSLSLKKAREKKAAIKTLLEENQIDAQIGLAPDKTRYKVKINARSEEDKSKILRLLKNGFYRAADYVLDLVPGVIKKQPKTNKRTKK